MGSGEDAGTAVDGAPASPDGDGGGVDAAVADAAATDALIDELAAATAALEDARAAVDEGGRDRLDRLADVHGDVDDLLSRYEERATDWDDFEGYAEFRQRFGELVAERADDLPDEAAEALAAADDHLVTGGVAETLSTADFERAREELAPLADAAERRRTLADARERYADARAALVAHRQTLAERIDELERLRRLGDADLDAPVDALREPVRTYDEGVRAAFADHREAAPVVDLLDLVAAAARRPMLDHEAPPSRLREFLATDPVGDEPLPTVLEYCSFSRSKLAHYVDDADGFRSAVATNQTYLESLSADPLTVGWPPPPADRLRYRYRETIPVVGRFAPPGTVAALRDLREIAERGTVRADDGDEVEYARLREAAVARDALDDAERERLRAGDVDDALERVRAARERVGRTLDEHPALDERPSLPADGDA